MPNALHVGVVREIPRRIVSIRRFKWWRTDLNRRPAGYESAALNQLSYATGDSMNLELYSRRSPQARFDAARGGTGCTGRGPLSVQTGGGAAQGVCCRAPGSLTRAGIRCRPPHSRGTPASAAGRPGVG